MHPPDSNSRNAPGIQDFEWGEGASVPCSPANLNDLVSGRLFTEPEIDDRVLSLSLVWLSLVWLSYRVAGGEAASRGVEGGARLSCLPLDPPLITKATRCP